MSHHRVISRSWTATVTLLSLVSLFVPLAHAKSNEKDRKQQTADSSRHLPDQPSPAAGDDRQQHCCRVRPEPAVASAH
jgi:hypothetical protein